MKAPGRLVATVAALVLSLPAAAAATGPLPGTWRMVTDGRTVEITLEADGRFARRDAEPGGSAMTVSGHWTVAPQGPWLRLTIEDWAPRRACGLLGCTAVRMLPGATYRYVLHGEDTLLLEDPGGRLALRRAE